jgi:hypothetical protein
MRAQKAAAAAPVKQAALASQAKSNVRDQFRVNIGAISRGTSL